MLEALPAKIPVRIEVDVTNLKIGRSIHVSELKPPEGCKFKFSTDYVVAFLAVPEKEEVVAPVAAVRGCDAGRGRCCAAAAGARRRGRARLRPLAPAGEEGRRGKGARGRSRRRP